MARPLVWPLISYLFLQKVMADGCGGELLGPSGTISYPEFGEDGYDIGMDCYWTITVQDERTIELKFEMIDIEEDDTCKYDFVQVFDGDISFGKYCGTALPDPILSITNSLTVHFHSDLTVNERGFHVTYWETEVKGLRICGTFVADEVGRFQSPDIDADGYYENNVSCSWVIISPMPEKVVQIYITDMDIPSDDDCRKDRIEIVDNNVTLSVLCGTYHPPIITSSTHVVHVNFYSDGSTTGTGFQAMFNVLDEDGFCGGILTEPNVTLTSPDRDSDNRYDLDLDCVWTIVAPQDKVIQLTFAIVNMEGLYGISCYYDKIRVYDRNVTYGTVCGYVEQLTFISASNILHVLFHSDSVGGFFGFEAVSYHIRKANFHAVERVANNSTEETDRPPSSEKSTTAKTSSTIQGKDQVRTTSAAGSAATVTLPLFGCLFCSTPLTTHTETSLLTTVQISTTTEQLLDDTTSESKKIKHTTTPKEPDTTGTQTHKLTSLKVMSSTTDKDSEANETNRANATSTKDDAIQHTLLRRTSTRDEAETNQAKQDIQTTHVLTDVTTTATDKTIDSTITQTPTKAKELQSPASILSTRLDGTSDSSGARKSIAVTSLFLICIWFMLRQCCDDNKNI